MKFSKILFLAFSSFLALIALLTAGAADPPNGADVPKGEIAKYSFDKSKIFPGTVRDYWVYVPKQYDPAKPARVYVTPNGRVANLCFGGANFDTLFATCGDRVYQRKLKERGCQAFQGPHKPAKPRW